MKEFFRSKLPLLYVLVTTSFLMSSYTTVPNQDSWQLLGKRTVNYKLDRDVIRITRSEGTFSKLKIKVTGGSLNMHKVIVQYGNGNKEEINMRHNFNRRSGSRTLDLKGRNRVIRDVTFFYDTDNRSRRRAKVRLFAR